MHPGTFAIGEYPVGESLIGEIREPHDSTFCSRSCAALESRVKKRLECFIYIYKCVVITTDMVFCLTQA
jgi:hypothetical protein